MEGMMTEKEKTISDMKDILLRLQALEAHAQAFCYSPTAWHVRKATKSIELAIKGEEG